MPNEIKIGQIKSDINNNIKLINENKKQINKLNELFNMFIINYNKDLEYYLNYYNKILYSFNNLRNYESIKNIMNFKIEKLYKDMFNFYNDNIKNKFKFLIDSFLNSINQMNIIYKINNEDTRIKLFDKQFVDNNKDNCFLIINNHIKEVCDYYTLKNNKKEKNLNVALIEKRTISDMSYMFHKCKSLIAIPDISKWNSYHITNMDSMFSNCLSLSSLPDISKWNTINVTNMKGIFSECSSLKQLPDISN